MSAEPRRVLPDPNDPHALGVHLRYMSSELYSVGQDVKAIQATLASVLRDFPQTYANASGVQQLAARVDALEAERDITKGAAPGLAQTMLEVHQIRAEVLRVQGGLQWLKVALTAFAIPLLSCLVAIVALAVRIWGVGS